MTHLIIFSSYHVVTNYICTTQTLTFEGQTYGSLNSYNIYFYINCNTSYLYYSLKLLNHNCIACEGQHNFYGKRFQIGRYEFCVNTLL